MVFEVGNVLGFLGLLSLIPLIILYLIKPRPVNLKVPSLMFFFSREKATTAESILRHFHEDILFVIQLLVLSFLALSLTQPLLNVKTNAASSNIVFVLDTSASSQVIESGGKTRFDIAKERIKDMATSRNSLVLVKSSPVLALQGVGRSELIRYLDRLEPSDDLSDISSAIVFAAELLGENKGRVVVLSDMISTKGVSVDLGEKILEGKGIPVDLINTAGSLRRNIGIVNMVLTADTANLYIKNYNFNSEEVNLQVGEELKKLKIKARSVEPYVFNLLGGDTQVEVQNIDDFYPDNKVIITRPYGDDLNVMLITNQASKFLKAALNSISGVKLTLAEPPVIPDGKYDVYLINDIKKETLLEGTFETLKEKVDNGNGNIVVGAWNGIENINFKGLFPGTINFKDGGAINIDQVTRFTKDVDFGDAKMFYALDSDEGTSIASLNGSSVIKIFESGKGKILYYGIADADSDFKLSPSYPIFWNNLINYLAGRSDLNEINLRTGGTLEVSNITSINLDKTGIFNFADKKISVNLLNEKESEINLIKKDSADIKPSDYELKSVKVDVDYDLQFYLTMFALLLIIFEFGYIKYRGEL